MVKAVSRSKKQSASGKKESHNRKPLKNKIKKHHVKLNIKQLTQKQYLNKSENLENDTEKIPLQQNGNVHKESRFKGQKSRNIEKVKQYHQKQKGEMQDKHMRGNVVKPVKQLKGKSTTQTDDLSHDKTSQWAQKRDKWRKQKQNETLHMKGPRMKYESSADKRHINSQVHKQSQPKRADIWFDDVDMDLIEQAEGKVKPTVKVTEKRNPLVQERSFDGLTKTVAMDCEMVGVGADGSDSILARVSIVNLYGKCIYDKYVKPTEKVTDYRTEVSGIRRGDIVKGADFKTVQQEVSDIIRNRLLVGHAIRNDLQVLFLDHPHKMIRDTMRYRPFRAHVNGRNPSLKRLASEVLGVEVQQGEHNSVQDAQAAMRLYTMHKIKWEEELSKKFWKPNPTKWKKSKKSVHRSQYVVDLEDSD